MRVWICKNLTGHLEKRTALMVANSPQEALRWMNGALRKCGAAGDFGVEDLQEISTQTASCDLL